jgi:DNA-binding MarR family transcriptional regulator
VTDVKSAEDTLADPRHASIDPRDASIDPGHATSSVGFLLSQLGFVMARRFRECLAPLDLEPRQFLVMRLVAFNEGQSQQALCAALNIPASRMVAVVDELEGRGLVERRADPTDRRRRPLHLTPEGRQLLGRALQLAMAHEQRVSSPLQPEEREHLIALLQRLVADQQLTAGVHPDLTTEDTDAGCVEGPSG